jgi:hypothetical protein
MKSRLTDEHTFLPVETGVAADAKNRGYGVEVVKDAVASFDPAACPRFARAREDVWGQDR